MNDFGFFRVAAAMPVVHPADCSANASAIIGMSRSISEADRPSVIVFPELSVCGYSCADLFGHQKLISDAEEAVARIAAGTAGLEPVIAVGAPVRTTGRLFNCAILIRKGRILGIVPKTYLAGNAEFYEPRWFGSARVLPAEGVSIPYAGQEDVLLGTHQIFRIGRALCGVELCQDLWSPVPPSTWAALAGAQVILNLSASNEVLLKHEYRKSLVSATSSRLFAAYVYCSCGYGESTQDLVWAGSSLIYDNGARLAESERFGTREKHICADVDIERLECYRSREHSFGFESSGSDAGRQAFITVDCGCSAATDFASRLLRHIEPHPFVPQGDPEALGERCREILSAQVLGLVTRLDRIHCRKAVIGISGGLDSTLALLATVLAFDELGIPRENIIGITMPGFGTTGRTYGNSIDLMRELGITQREISILPSVRQHFSDIGQDENRHDLTYENSQARERTQILMDTAGLENGIVIGTGDLSELALGWCTYNGDHMSMYAVNVSVPKTLVRTLVSWAADHRFPGQEHLRATLHDIVATPISPELVPGSDSGRQMQDTEDLVGPYELHDFFLYNFFRFGYGPEKILFLAKRAFAGVYPEDIILKWLKTFMHRFFTQQFKRSCIPDGPKVGSVTLSPRGDWRMPSDLGPVWDICDKA